MSDSMKQKAPGWFMAVAVLALLWNLMGVFAFITQVTMTPETLAQLPQNQQNLYTSIPTWVTVAYAIAVNFGVLGCLLLILKKSLAGMFLQLSLAAVLAQNFYSFFMANVLEVLGSTALVLPLLVILIAICLVVLAAKARRMHWTS